MNKHIVYGKIGQSTIFNSNNWGANGGNNESPVLLTALANNNPNDTFYIIGKSDFSRITPELKKSLFKYDNVIDVWATFGRGRPKEDCIDWVSNWFKDKNITVDGGIIYTGPHGRANIPEFTYAIRNTDNYAKPLEMFVGYCAPIIKYLNDSMIPWICLVPDPRYYPIQARDLANWPIVACSQITMDGLTADHISDPNDPRSIVESSTSLCYSAIETVFLLDKKDWRDTTPQVKTDNLLSFDEEDTTAEFNGITAEKDIDLMIVCNQGSLKFKRYDILKEYVLDSISDVEVYGKWEDEYYKDTRLKGPVKFNDLQTKLARTKYTFMIPIEKHWATAKWCEMAHYGIIPFMHPMYDTQNNTKLPEFLRVKDSKDLFNKIEYLNSNPKEYEKLKRQIMECLTPDMYSGKLMSDLLMRLL